MLKWLAAKLGPKRIEDPIFGSLVFMKVPDPTKWYWEGKGTFPPLGVQIEYFIDAGEDGPGDAQRRFWKQLCDRYEELFLELSGELSGAYTSWLHREAPKDLSGVFSLSSISIPRQESQDAEWDLSFECRDDREHLFTVSMRGWRAEGGVQVDG